MEGDISFNFDVVGMRGQALNIPTTISNTSQEILSTPPNFTNTCQQRFLTLNQESEQSAESSDTQNPVIVEYTILQPAKPTNPALLQLLTEWGMEQLYAKCLEEDITIESLKYMTRRHCELLTKNFKLGTLIKFEHHLSRWQMAEKTTICSGSSTSCTTTFNDHNEIFRDTKSDLQFINLEDVIKGSSQGRSILEKYRNNPRLTDGMRTILVELIINHFIQNDIKMSVYLAEDLAEKVVVLFPSETKDLYFLKDKGKTLGKIYSKYYNQIRTLKNSGLLDKKSTTNECKFPENENLPEPEENIEFSIEAIRSENCSWPELEQHWSATVRFRSLSIKKALSTTEIMAQWSHYKRPLGFKLIDIDYTYLYPKSGSFIISFPEICDTLIIIYEEHLSSSCTSLFSEFKEKTFMSENGRYACILYLLHGVLVPKSQEVKKGATKKLHTRPSIKDSQNSFMIIGSTIQEVETTLLRLKERREAIQPLILLTGSLFEPKDILIYFDDIKYKLFSILQAVDICFKIFNVFNLQYPSASVLVWIFIQKFFYKITTKFDRNYPIVNFLCNELKNERKNS